MVMSMDRQVTACGGQRLGHDDLEGRRPGSRGSLALLLGVTKEARAVKRLWRDYNLSVVLDLLFIASWVGQLITQWFI
jgi:hypothetical protein